MGLLTSDTSLSTKLKFNRDYCKYVPIRYPTSIASFQEERMICNWNVSNRICRCTTATLRNMHFCSVSSTISVVSRVTVLKILAMTITLTNKYLPYQHQQLPTHQIHNCPVPHHSHESKLPQLPRRPSHRDGDGRQP
jgi:hypothetical protein